jgi:hypothetical protein
MSKRKLIHVIQDDIDKGSVGSANSCPVARALKRKFPQYGHVLVFTYSVRMWNDINYNAVFYTFPEKVSTFIKAYDRGQKMEPFNFYLKEINDD